MIRRTTASPATRYCAVPADSDTYGDGQGSWEFVAIQDDTGTSGTEYTDTSVTPRTRYVYRVKARNPAGLGERSSYANAETSAAPEPTPEPSPEPTPEENPEGGQQQESAATKDNGGNGQNPRQQQTTSDASLSSLSANGIAVPGVDQDSTEYTLGVGNEVSRVTLVVEPKQAGATVRYTGLQHTDADDTTDGHQVDLFVGRNIIEFTVTAQDEVTTQDYTLTINRGTHVETGWTVLKDLENVLGSGSESPGGIWSDGTLIWVSGGDDLKLYAYQLSTGERESDRDIALHSDNADPKGIWSDGETIWVVDSADRDLYAYNLESGARDSAKDFTDLGDEDADYYGIWSDGETIWVSDKIGPVVEAFDIDTGEKVPALSYTGMEASAHDYVAGIWSDGVTMLVVGTESEREIIWEYDSPESEVSLDQGQNYRTLDGAGNHSPGAIWSDGETLWVSDTEDGKIYTYNMRVSDNTDLRSITVDGTAVPGVNPDSTEYTLGVGNEVSRVTLVVEPRQAGATVRYTGLQHTDADDTTDGHQVDLFVGRNIIEFTVTAQDEVTTQDYTLTINRGTHVETGWTVLKDLENVLGSGSESPGGIWSDGTLIWVSGGDDLKLYAYQLSTGERESDRDIALHSGNTDPKGIWSDGETIWVVDSADRDLYAYNLESGARDSAKDFTDLGDEDADYYGIWSDGETIWVSDKIGPVVEAFDIDTGEKVPALSYTGMEASAHDYVAGIWSDGVTMLVVGTESEREIIWEYDSPESEVSLDQGQNYRTLDGAGNHSPGAIWSDGETLWVSDTEDGKVYTYNMRVSDNTDLRSVTVDGAAVPGVVPGATQFLYRVANSTRQVTLATVPRHLKSTVFSDPLDADGASEGQQINLEVGSNTIKIVVRAQDKATLVEYTLTINRASTASTEWAVLQDLEDVLGSGSDYPGGIWSDGTLIWVSGGDDLKLHAYGLATGEHDSDRDIALHSGNADPKGIWSDGTTMWVLDNDDRTLYAYDLETGARDSAMDLTGLGDEDADYYGIWSDGETMWVSDKTGPVVEAFDMDTGDKVPELRYTGMEPSDQDHVAGIWSDGLTMWAVDPDRNIIFAYDSPDSELNQQKDFRTLDSAGNTSPTGIWSDGETLWVADGEDGKIYSYNMPASDNAELRKVVVDGMEAAGSTVDGAWYATVGSTSTQATVAVTAAQLKATPSYGVADSDAATDGYQLAIPDLTAGVTITVTAQNEDIREHTLTVSKVNTDSARKARVGGSATGDLTSPEEFAVVAVDLVTDELYRFDLEGVDNGDGALTNPRLLGLFKLVYGTAVPVGDTDDFLGGYGTNSSEVHHEPKPEGQAKATRATYYIVVGSETGASGGYRLSVSHEDEATADTSTTANVEVLPSTRSSGKRGKFHFRGVIGEPDDIDWIKVTLEADQMYRIVLKSATTGNFRTLTEPILIGLYTGDGTENYVWGTLAAPYGQRFEARIHYYAESAGVYYISARGFEDDTGSYDLLVMEVEDDCQPDNTSTHDAIAVGETKKAAIDYGGDTDWFRAELTGGKTYEATVAQGEGSHPLPLPKVRIYNSSATMVALGDWSSELEASVASISPASSGTYYIVASSMIGRSGLYTVSLSELSEE